MASKAYLVINGIDTGPVKANSLSDSDRDKVFHCCGHDLNNHICRCRLYLHMRKDKHGNPANYFSADSEPHINNCEYAETGIWKLVKHFNMAGTTPMTDLFSKFGPSKSISAIPDTANSNTKKEAVSSSETDDLIAEIVRQSVDPRSTKELFLLLKSLDFDTAIYSGIPVKDILFDRENRAKVYNGELPENTPVLVSCHNFLARHFPNNIADFFNSKGMTFVNNNLFVFRYYSHSKEDESEMALFVFKASTNVMELINHYDKPKKRYVLFARWRQINDFPLIYITSDLITDKRIYRFNPDHID